MPRWSDTIELITVVNDKNDVGDAIENEAPRKVYANRKSIRQSEFYQAMASGLKPEIMFEVMFFDYKDEKRLVYNGKKYSIIRTYITDSDKMELICEGLSNNGAT